MILGRSGMIDPDGLILSGAGRYVGMVTTEIDLDKPRLAHSFAWAEEGDFWTAILADQRSDVYGAIIDPDLSFQLSPKRVHPARCTRPNSRHTYPGQQ
jgi:hypothetical protein